MGGCQNYGPFLGTLNNRCRMRIGTQNGTIILTTTHIAFGYMDPWGLLNFTYSGFDILLDPGCARCQLL